MKRAVALGCIIASLAATVCRGDLAGDVDAVLKDKFLQRASVGIEIVRLGATEAETQEIYQRDGHAPLTPASNLKLATTSAAIDRLGPDFKFRTILLMHDGDAVLIGDGDPAFEDSEYLKRVGWKPNAIYENWCGRLKSLNISSVRNVIVDDSVFDEEFLHPDWPANQIDHWYVAEVGGMNLNTNCVNLVIEPASSGGRVGLSLMPATHFVSIENSCVTGANNVMIGRQPGTNQVVLKGQAPGGGPSEFQETIHDPPLYAATVLSETLDAAGIKVGGEVKRDRTIRQQRQKGPASLWRIVAIHETPLAVVLARANKDSINLYAECLCKRLGHEVSGQGGSWTNGTAAVGEFLRHSGVPATEFRLDDGSGLSKHNAISASALTRVLVHNYCGKNRDAFLSSLSVAGVDGTLQDRFRGAGLRGRVVGKSGFVEGVSCLSGYLTTRDGDRYAFSILMNGLPPKSNALAKALQEKIVEALDRHTGTATARR